MGRGGLHRSTSVAAMTVTGETTRDMDLGHTLLAVTHTKVVLLVVLLIILHHTLLVYSKHGKPF
jgi:hypothetical protein